MNESPMPGDTIDGRYRLRREIARGGMASVFEAEHLFTGRTIALKVLLAAHAQVSEVRDRLLREARVLGALWHRSIVQVYDAGADSRGRVYVVMEMLDGRTLDGILATRGPLPVSDVVQVGRQACEALAVAHARGVIHRDIKPSNVFVQRDPLGDETVKLIDFGIAGTVRAEMLAARTSRPAASGAGGSSGAGGAAGVSSSSSSSSSPSSRPSGPAGAGPKLTQIGAVMGTPEYMPPEQLMGEPLDGRADVYSLGIALYECLAGRVPFPGVYEEVVPQVLGNVRPPSLRGLRSEVSFALESAVLRAISHDRTARYPDAASFGRALLEASKLTPAASTLLAAGEPGSNDAADSTGPVPAARGLGDAADSDSPVLLVRRRAAPINLSRRRAPRAPYVTPVTILRANGTRVEGRSEDVSEVGLLVLSRETCPRDETVHLRFALPGTGEMVTVPAKVCWERAARELAALGFEFVGLSSGVRAAIAEYVQQMAGRKVG